MTVNYRESYGLHANCGILFNHESPRRGTEFVTRKIPGGGQDLPGVADHLLLGNLPRRTDWGFAGDYVEAMYLMLQEDEPGDYVIATARRTPSRSFLDLAFGVVGSTTGRRMSAVDERFIRPAEVDQWSAIRARRARFLGWKPR